MKDKRPIATQVAELSDQQRKTIRRVGVCYDIVMCLVVVIYLAVTVFFLVQFTELFKAILGFFMVRSGVWLQNIVSKTQNA